MKRGAAIIRRFARAWDRFWFEAEAPEQLRLFRLGLGLLLFAFYIVRGFDLEFYFGQAGMLPLEVMNETMPMQYRPSLFQYFSGNGALWIGHGIFLTSLLTLAFGWMPRLSALVAFVLHVSFLHRNMASVFGIDLIATFYLLYLSMVDLRPARSESAKTLTSVMFRLGQIQPCIIYAFSGLEKMKGTHWWRGEAIWDVLANSQLARFDFAFIAQFPLLIVIATYVTLAWEIYFPILIWIRPIRPWMMLIGVMLHVGIGISINIPFFSGIMMLLYSLFLTPRRAKQFHGALTGWLPGKKYCGFLTKMSH